MLRLVLVVGALAFGLAVPAFATANEAAACYITSSGGHLSCSLANTLGWNYAQTRAVSGSRVPYDWILTPYKTASGSDCNQSLIIYQSPTIYNDAWDTVYHGYGPGGCSFRDLIDNRAGAGTGYYYRNFY